MVACFSRRAIRDPTGGPRNGWAVHGFRFVLEWNFGQEQRRVVRPGLARYRRIADSRGIYRRRNLALSRALEALTPSRAVVSEMRMLRQL